MKITGIETHVVNAVQRNWVFVKVLTDQPGLYGWGEATLEWKTRAVVGAVEDIAPMVVGEDPTRIEYLVTKVQRHSFWPLGVVGLSALSAIEQALWDISGKDLGVPVWRLLGGRCRDKVRVYGHYLGGRIEGQKRSTDDIQAYVEGVIETVEMGYDAIKMLIVPYTHYHAPLPQVKQVGRLMEAIRDAVGDEIDIMMEFHGRCGSISAALAYIDVLAPHHPLFVEEPIQPGDHQAMAQITARAGCPIATGERLFTVKDYLDLAALKAVNIIQPDLCHCGGIFTGKKIAGVAEASHMGVAPHNPQGPISGAVSLHFDVSTPNFVIQEEVSGIVPWFDDVVDHPLKREGSYWPIPEKPGLGVDINEKEAARHPFEPEVIPATEAKLADGTIVAW